jgi:hypothetical protein
MKKYLVLIALVISMSAHALPGDSVDNTPQWITVGPCCATIPETNQSLHPADSNCMIYDGAQCLNSRPDYSTHKHAEVPYGALIGDFGDDGVFIFAPSFNQEIIDDLALNRRIKESDKNWLRSTWILQQRLKVAEDWLQLMLDEKWKNVGKVKIIDAALKEIN